MTTGPRGVHDMGGIEAGSIDRQEHATDFWEQRVDAIMNCLGRRHGEREPVMRTDELRRGVEALGPAAYDSLSYYERWITAITNILLERGVVSVEELGRKLDEVAAREHGV